MHLKELDANLIVVLDALLIDASVTKAAERLGRSPSAVSHALANLRHIFDDELFVRAGQRLTPTMKAKELAPTVHIIVSGLESLLRPTTPFDPATQERTFLIACTEMAELYLLPSLRGELHAQAPSIFIERVGPDTTQFLEELRHSRIDFALIEGGVPLDVPDMHWEKIKQEPYVTLRRYNETSKNKKITLKAFQKLPHIITQTNNTTECPLQLHLERHCSEQTLITKVSSSLAGLLLALEMDGLVTIPNLHAQIMNNYISAQEVCLPFKMPMLDIHLGWHRSFERDECHQWFRQKIKAHFEVVKPAKLAEVKQA